MSAKIRSAADILLPKSYEIVWRRGDAYVDQGLVKIAQANNTEAKALVRGGEEYTVRLTFSGGGLRHRCTCPYARSRGEKQIVCKHVVAAAIAWDEARNFKRPSDKEIEDATISEPVITWSDVNRAYQDPLVADLEVICLAASEIDPWSRPHSRLPLAPKFNIATSSPLSREEVKRAHKTMEKWRMRLGYDEYFCAGEMVAAFCEIMRKVIGRAPISAPLVLADILLDAQAFNFKLVSDLIDNSDELHLFSEAHLDALRDIVERIKVPKEDKPLVDEKLWNYDKRRDNY